MAIVWQLSGYCTGPTTPTTHHPSIPSFVAAEHAAGGNSPEGRLKHSTAFPTGPPTPLQPPLLILVNSSWHIKKHSTAFPTGPPTPLQPPLLILVNSSWHIKKHSTGLPTGLPTPLQPPLLILGSVFPSGRAALPARLRNHSPPPPNIKSGVAKGHS